jgi:hypothetical protein
VYEIYEVGPAARTLIAKETISYGPDRMARSSQEGNSTRVKRRELLLASGFAIGCSDYGEKQPKGFGCWLKRSRSQVALDQYEGFSWEWYDQGVGSLYAKRQGGAKASLKTMPLQREYAMESLEFLEDTVFRANLSPKGEPGVFTHELVVRNGSTLVFRSP